MKDEFESSFVPRIIQPKLWILWPDTTFAGYLSCTYLVSIWCVVKLQQFHYDAHLVYYSRSCQTSWKPSLEVINCLKYCFICITNRFAACILSSCIIDNTACCHEVYEASRNILMFLWISIYKTSKYLRYLLHTVNHWIIVSIDISI